MHGGRFDARGIERVYIIQCPNVSNMNLSQKCGSGFRARRGAAEKRSIHGSM